VPSVCRAAGPPPLPPQSEPSERCSGSAGASATDTRQSAWRAPHWMAPRGACVAASTTRRGSIATSVCPSTTTRRGGARQPTTLMSAGVSKETFHFSP
jgi:hypothetical protein